MINREDSNNTFEYSDYYKILPSLIDKKSLKKYIKKGKKVKENFVYSSDQNIDWMKTEALSKWIKKNCFY